jgi:N6-adenosine-specific RNA methylase IME4
MAEGRFQTIVADPPWPIKWRGDASIGTRTLDYPTLTIAEIIETPVREWAAGDCNLFLWTTNQFLPEALGVARAWGFQYRMLWTWCKPGGMGGHPRNATEHMVLASRGAAKAPGRNAPATLNWKLHKRLDHSRKPEAFYDDIEAISPGPYLELFARQQRLGWERWGNEVESTVELVA